MAENIYPAKKYIPGLGRQVRIVKDELDPALLEELGGSGEVTIQDLVNEINSLKTRLSALEG